MATHSSFLAWRIPETGEPGGLPSMGSHRVGHDWSDLAAAASPFRGLYSHDRIFFQRLHLQTPSHWGLGLHQINYTIQSIPIHVFIFAKKSPPDKWMIIIDSDCLNVWLSNSRWIQCYMKYYHEMYSKWEFLPSKLLRVLVIVLMASLMAQLVKNPPAVQETWVQSLGSEDPLEKDTAAHSSILAWRIPWTV